MIQFILMVNRRPRMADFVTC